MSNSEISPTLHLAPMAGYTDHAMRVLCGRFGADCAVTEMVSAAALCYGDEKTVTLARLYADEPPTAVQLFGHDPAQMEKAVGIVLARAEKDGILPAAIDINMGCPVKKIISGGDGSALMKTPALCAELVRAARRGAKPWGLPVTVKIRAGWDSEHRNAEEVALATAEAGVSAVCVHGRTREQMYTGKADWSIIAAVREALPPEIPVIGNGDVTDSESCFRLLRETHCGGVAIGRAAADMPWIFAELKAAARGEAYTPPTVSERLDIAREMACLVVADKGEGTGIRECRGRVAHLFGGLRGAAALRNAVHTVNTLEELLRLLSDFSQE